MENVIEDAKNQTSPRPTLLNRVLLVEDNMLAQKATLFILKKFNCAIDTATTAEAALTQAKNNHYDIIFMDIGLPDRDGMEVTSEIRAWEKSQQKQPAMIFALTAHADEAHKQQCLKSGMDEVFHKPLMPEHKQAILERLIKVKNQAAEALDVPVIDWTQADKLAGGSRENAEQLLAATVRELPIEKKRIIDAYDAGQSGEVADLVHRLHGVLCYVGAPALKVALFNIENAITKNEPYQEQYNNLLQAIDNLIDAYQPSNES